jgi:hypothetical protein
MAGRRERCRAVHSGNLQASEPILDVGLAAEYVHTGPFEQFARFLHLSCGESTMLQFCAEAGHVLAAQLAGLPVLSAGNRLANRVGGARYHWRIGCPRSVPPRTWN